MVGRIATIELRPVNRSTQHFKIRRAQNPVDTIPNFPSVPSAQSCLLLRSLRITQPEGIDKRLVYQCTIKRLPSPALKSPVITIRADRPSLETRRLINFAACSLDSLPCDQNEH